MNSDQSLAGKTAGPVTSGAALLGEIAREAKDALEPLLESMFGACDDFFFDLASRAKSNQEQNLYFESLREIRQKKPALIAEFDDAIRIALLSLGQRAAPARKEANRKPATAKPLELITKEQIEKDVLVTDMVTRARLEWQQELFQLHERLAAIAVRKFGETEMPLDPARIAEAFTAACASIDVELRILKFVYRQFDRHVMRELDELYHRANQVLVSAGILPKLAPLARRTIRKHESPPPKPVGPAPAPAEPGIGIPETEPELRELAHLLQRLRAGGMRLPMFPAAPPGTPVAPPIAREELISLLSDVQLQAVPPPGGTQQPLDIRHAIEAIVANRGHLSVGQADEDVINVVAMFFDLILDDRNLPIEIQALVSRLQLPILKVALKDRTFFTERKHPARQLINEIARTSIGWDTSNKDAQDALYIRLTELVEEVLRNSADHPEVFERCLNDLMRFITRNEQRAAKIEQRSSEKAHAEARLSAARDMARHVLQERLEGKELPAAITTFLVEDWQQVLQLVYLRHGRDSAEWVDAVQTVDDLLWSVQAHTDEKSRARQARLLPDLYRRMSAGLGQTHSHATEAEPRIDVIRDIHRNLAAGAPETATPLPVAPLSPTQKEMIRPERTADERSWREMTAVERQKVQYEALMFEYLKRVDDLPLGTWLEYDDLRRALTRRCKLSARIDETRMFIFVNRLGTPVFEKPRKAFAYDLQMGHARLIEDAPLFDRTLARISANLRKLAGDG